MKGLVKVEGNRFLRISPKGFYYIRMSIPGLGEFVKSTKSTNLDEAKEVAKQLIADAKQRVNSNLRRKRPPIAEQKLGYFYLVRVAPQLHPNWVKLGFTSDVGNRMKAYKTVSPTMELVEVWECYRTWEKRIIKAVTRGFERLGPEVFMATDLNKLKFDILAVRDSMKARWIK